MEKLQTRSQIIATEVQSLIRARNAVLWVITKEEGRVEDYLKAAASAAGYVPYTWDVAQGVCDIAGNLKQQIPGKDVGDMLETIRQRSESGTERSVWIMRDLPVWLQGPIGATPLRMLRNLARSLPGASRNSAQTVIVLTPSADIPPELSGHAVAVEWPLPDRQEIADILDTAIEIQPDDVKEKVKASLVNGQRSAAIDAAIGLTGEEAEACYASCLVRMCKIDPATVSKEKKRIITRERVLEWYDPIPGGLEAVGGLDNLKRWLVARAAAYSPKAREYGLPAPNGAMIVGISGCGKSLTAKAVATAWGVPLLKLDLGALKSKFVGESEGNLRKALKVIEAIGRCVVWLDEVEKALQGATSGSADGGVSSDALGTVLTWMQERKGEAFVIATANDVSALPPEFLRKGRFDEVWWVDVPNAQERIDVLGAALRAHKRQSVVLNLTQVCEACEGFTGAEIASIVPEALFAAFADKGREIRTDDLIAAARTVVPLTKTAKQKIDAMREWSKGNARPASAELQVTQAKRARVLDMA